MSQGYAHLVADGNFLINPYWIVNGRSACHRHQQDSLSNQSILDCKYNNIIVIVVRESFLINPNWIVNLFTPLLRQYKFIFLINPYWIVNKKGISLFWRLKIFLINPYWIVNCDFQNRIHCLSKLSNQSILDCKWILCWFLNKRLLFGPISTL